MGLKVRELIRQMCKAFEIEILKGVVNKDHVHLFISAPPHLHRVKGRSSAKLFQAFPHLKNRDWGRYFYVT